MTDTISTPTAPESSDEAGRLLALVGASSAAVRFETLRELVHLSKTAPRKVYPHFDEFAKLLQAENQVVRWNAIFVLANLAAVDAGKKWDALLEAFLAPVKGPVLITAANIIKCAPSLAQARPAYAGKLEEALLGVAHARYQTRECRNVALGHALRSLDRMWSLLPDAGAALEFAQRQRRNPRNATRRAAEAIFKRHAQPAPR